MFSSFQLLTWLPPKKPQNLLTLLKAHITITFKNVTCLAHTNFSVCLVLSLIKNSKKPCCYWNLTAELPWIKNSRMLVWMLNFKRLLVLKFHTWVICYCLVKFCWWCLNFIFNTSIYFKIRIRTRHNRPLHDNRFGFQPHEIRKRKMERRTMIYFKRSDHIALSWRVANKKAQLLWANNRTNIKLEASCTKRVSFNKFTFWYNFCNYLTLDINLGPFVKIWTYKNYILITTMGDAWGWAAQHDLTQI